MSLHLAKSIDITPNGVLRPGFPQDYREIRKQAWFPQLLATTSHIRFWVDWPSLQPDGNVPFGQPVNDDHAKKLFGLDEQIRLANQDGLKTILLPYRYPRWVNGTENINQPFGWDNFFYKPADRAALSTWSNWYLDQNNFARALRSGPRCARSSTSCPPRVTGPPPPGAATSPPCSTGTSPTATASAGPTTSRSSTSRTSRSGRSARRPRSR